MSDLNNIKFLDRWEGQGKMRLHVDVIMISCSVSRTHAHTKSLSGFVSVVSGSELMARDRMTDQSGWHGLLPCERSPL